jgi:predicted nucleic acid-binding protein
LILADTSVWIDHLHREIGALSAHLRDRQIITHPFVIGELAVGHLSQRQAVLSDLTELASTTTAADVEVMFLLERHRLFGSGISYIDAHLLTATLITPGVRLWTRDRHLKAAALSLGVAADET